jgi:hypothetical protein
VKSPSKHRMIIGKYDKQFNRDGPGVPEISTNLKVFRHNKGSPPGGPWAHFLTAMSSQQVTALVPHVLRYNLRCSRHKATLNVSDDDPSGHPSTVRLILTLQVILSRC